MVSAKKYWFVPVLDAAEIIPFAIRKSKNVRESFAAQDKSREQLARFIPALEKAFGEKITNIGSDVIGEKFYERYLFDKDGFLEIMMEAPLAMNAHFSDEKCAKRFAAALKKALGTVLPKNPMSKMLVDNIQPSSTEESELKVETWDKIKGFKV
ncbi:MAG: hypothetical protein V1839_03070 [archaeon]